MRIPNDENMRNIVISLNVFSCFIAVAILVSISFSSYLKFERGKDTSSNIIEKIIKSNDTDILKKNLIKEIRYSDSMLELLVSGKDVLRTTLCFFLFTAVVNIYAAMKLRKVPTIQLNQEETSLEQNK